MIEIKQIDQGTKGYFVASDAEHEAGRITYTFAGNSKIIIDHTEVNNAYRGQNIGKRILMEVVNYARENKIKIIPLCPFAKSVFDKVEEIRDVL
jgi:predicted GNAT family acetyltransferase